MNKKINLILRIILLSILYITSIIFLYNIHKLNILNNLYLSIIFIIVLGLLFLISYKLLKNKTSKISKIIFSILSIILIIVFFISYTYINSTSNFIKNITNNDKEYKEYSVIVLKNSKYNNIIDLNNTKLGFIDENNTDNSVNSLKNISKISFTFTRYNDIGTVLGNLLNNEVQGISVDSNYLDMLEDNNYKNIDDIKVIYTYKVIIDKDNSNNKVLDTNKPFILYLSGSDSRSGIKTTARSDVNIVVVVNPNNHKILLVSIPRDYYVQLHGTSGNRDKLTHAGVYGIDMSINTINDLLDINIDDYVKVSFNTVINSVDIIDGIDIYSDKSFTAWTNKKCSYVEGVQHVDGTCALAFARERKTYDTGDRHRGENQEQVITKIIEKASNPKYLVKYNEILKKIDGSFETSLSYEEITSFVKEQLNNLSNWEVETYNLNGYDSSGYTYSMPGWYLYDMDPDMNTINTAKEKIKECLKS